MRLRQNRSHGAVILITFRQHIYTRNCPLTPIIVNLIYATLGGTITLLFMWVGYFVINRFTPLDIARELAEGNRAVGSMVMGMFIGIGVAMGLVIGLSLN